MRVSVHLFERIRQLARDGLGYEDIAARLNISWREVRPFVIGNRNDNQRTRDTAAVRTAQDRD